MNSPPHFLQPIFRRVRGRQASLRVPAGELDVPQLHVWHELLVHEERKADASPEVQQQDDAKLPLAVSIFTDGADTALHRPARAPNETPEGTADH